MRDETPGMLGTCFVVMGFGKKISANLRLKRKLCYAGEQMRQGLKPCDRASEAVEKPTRFLVEMRFTQSQVPR